ncbi:thiol reductant ABC exporter subunit CydC [Rarobacter incanus]|uniref:ATP-binding cassette subfamily C protein CydC n=1 Tax=Rarobacter incanus TaxID=153494 RepID=A0A542SP52_9MICO|nr:thiol reductant ABC exporter subunit CydC [Rarobacter incanus]TQK76037.1 ATP-binding cassette subfamily C protein CydC [Rarobacter incanus]
MGDIRVLRWALSLVTISWARVARAVLLGTAALGSAVALGAFSAWLIAWASKMPPVLALSTIVVAVRAFGISRGVFRYLERLASHHVALTTMGQLRTKLYERLAAAPIGAVTALRRGDLLARVGADVDTVGEVVVRAMIPAGISLCVSAATVIAMAVLLPAAGWWLAIGLAVASVLGPYLTALGARSAARAGAQAHADTAAAALDLIDHATDITVAGKTRAYLSGIRESDRRWIKATDRGARALGAGAAAGTLGLAVAVLGALICGIPAVSSGKLSDIALAVVVLTPLAAFESTMVLPAAALQVFQSAAAARRLRELWDNSAPRAAHPAAQPLVDPDLPCALRTRNLAVGWDGSRSAITIGDVDLPVGASLLVTGASGSGKTTLLATLAGLIAPVRGSVERRAATLMTAEDAHIFNTTVLENLRVARGDITRDEARAALRLVGLDSWFAAQPEGLDTMLGNDGISVSGGERRRLLIARALLARAPILVIDEPAEHLDSASAYRLLDDLLRLPAATAGSRFPVLAVVIASHHVGARPAGVPVVSLHIPGLAASAH